MSNYNFKRSIVVFLLICSMLFTNLKVFAMEEVDIQSENISDDKDTAAEDMSKVTSTELDENKSLNSDDDKDEEDSLEDSVPQPEASDLLRVTNEEKELRLIDRVTLQISQMMLDGKYIWVMEDSHIKYIGGENETFVVPGEIKAWYGSRQSGVFGKIGYKVNPDEEPTQTIVIESGNKLTVSRFIFESNVKFVVKNGATLNLRDSTLNGQIIVENGGILQVNYDPDWDMFLRGAYINGQVILESGAILENSLLYSYLKDIDSIEPVESDEAEDFPIVRVVKKDDSPAIIRGNVFIRGHETDFRPALSSNGGGGSSSEFNFINSDDIHIDHDTEIDSDVELNGQPALVLETGASLMLGKSAVLGLYGGGFLPNTAQGGSGLVLQNESEIYGEGKLIAVGGTTRKGSGISAVSGSGSISVKNLYLKGGDTFDENAEGGAAKDEGIKFRENENFEITGTLASGAKLEEGVEITRPDYWVNEQKAPDITTINFESTVIVKKKEPADEKPETIEPSKPADHVILPYIPVIVEKEEGQLRDAVDTRTVENIDEIIDSVLPQGNPDFEKLSPVETDSRSTNSFIVTEKVDNKSNSDAKKVDYVLVVEDGKKQRDIDRERSRKSDFITASVVTPPEHNANASEQDSGAIKDFSKDFSDEANSEGKPLDESDQEDDKNGLTVSKENSLFTQYENLENASMADNLNFGVGIYLILFTSISIIGFAIAFIMKNKNS